MPFIRSGSFTKVSLRRQRQSSQDSLKSDTSTGEPTNIGVGMKSTDILGMCAITLLVTVVKLITT